MTLQQLSKTVDFVQATTPSNANDGETYLDTSQSPPQLKVFDSSANAFVRPRSIQNLDAPVSNAGATQSDIETGAEGALEEDIANLSPASNSVAANLDGGVAAVDWSSKTPKVAEGKSAISGTNLVSVSGSGYITNISWSLIVPGDSYVITVDGTTLANFQPFNNTAIETSSNNTVLYSGINFRFNSSFDLSTGSSVSSDVGVVVSYVLD